MKYYHYVCDEQGSVSHIIRGEDKENGAAVQDRVLNHYEYDPVTRQYYLRARYYNPVDSKSGYKDSGVGNGNDPWRSYSSRNGSNILFLPGPSQSSFNVGE